MNKVGLTLDTGALIALASNSGRMRKVFRLAVSDGQVVSVSTAVIAEWWRVPTRFVREEYLAAMNIEPVSYDIAVAAGGALMRVPGVGVVDAIVMASAALRGDLVYTSDLPDLTRLQTEFPSVKILHV